MWLKIGHRIKDISKKFIMGIKNVLNLKRVMVDLFDWGFIASCLKGGDKMDRRDLLLAALTPAAREPYTPVQLQKMMFLIDREIPDLVGGTHFRFEPYNYGPFDRAVYDELEALEAQGYVETMGVHTWRNYRLTKAGQEFGEKILDSLPPEAQDYLRRVSEFVRSLSFRELVLAIYKAFPEMKENSVFQY